MINGMKTNYETNSRNRLARFIEIDQQQEDPKMYQVKLTQSELLTLRQILTPEVQRLAEIAQDGKIHGLKEDAADALLVGSIDAKLADAEDRIDVFDFDEDLDAHWSLHAIRNQNQG